MLKTKTWSEVLSRLLEESVLIEDQSTGIIQIHPTYYYQLGKPIPGSVNKNKERAKTLATIYQNLWPKKILSGNRPVRQGLITITKKLNVFLNKHSQVTDAQIIEATNRYINKCKSNNWAYAVCSDYFISKNDSSQLEAFIEDKDLNSKDSLSKEDKSLTQRFV